MPQKRDILREYFLLERRCASSHALSSYHASGHHKRTQDIARTEEGGPPAQLADAETFVAAMEERGVGGGKRVVVYDNGDMLFATRFWWAMRYVCAPEERCRPCVVVVVFFVFLLFAAAAADFKHSALCFYLFRSF